MPTIQAPNKQNPNVNDAMTVGQLRERLKQLPEDIPIFVYDLSAGDRNNILAVDVFNTEDHKPYMVDLNYNFYEEKTKNE